MLRADLIDDRKRWFTDVMACRRRPQGAVARLKGRGVGLVLSMEDEYHLLVQSATCVTIALSRSLGAARRLRPVTCGC